MEKHFLTKKKRSEFSEQDIANIIQRCDTFNFNTEVHQTIFQKLENELDPDARTLSNTDIILRSQRPLPFLNEKRLYGKFKSRNDAMEEIVMNSDRFVVVWYAIIAPDGRRYCPADHVHGKKSIKRGQSCLAVDFNSIVRSTKEGVVYRIKDQRRFFCLQQECVRSFSKKELKDFSNISPPTVINIDYLGERSKAQVCAMFPNLKTTGDSDILNDE